MNFIYQDLGERIPGDTLETTLSSIANVRLMDGPNFEQYKNGAEHKYFGGLVKTSPSTLTIPSAGQWFVVVDMKDLSGSAQASFRVIPAPTVMHAPALTQVPSLLRQFPPTLELNGENVYDVFLTYASEDKETIIKALCSRLDKKGLSVWHNEFDSRLGSNLRNKIDFGIERSRFGLIIFSKAFFEREWQGEELDRLIVTESHTNPDEERQILLPIWHGITKQEVINYSPALAEKVARSTTTHTLVEITDEIAQLVKGA